MEVTGKNKIKFEAWYINDFQQDDRNNQYHILLDSFYDLDEKMKKGVYEAYYDSIEYYIYVGTHGYRLTYPDGDKIEKFGINNRLEAFTAALKKANELVNETIK